MSDPDEDPDKDPGRDPGKDPGFERVFPLKQTAAGPRPFPTLYWLTAPDLLRAISDLERRGRIAELVARVEADAAFRAAVASDHRRYARERWALLDAPARERVAAHGFTAALRDRGVGGAAHPEAVKCLHAHAAHALADRAADRPQNVIGAEVLADSGVKLPRA